MASAYPGALDSLATTKQDDVDVVTGVDAGTTTNVGDHAAHHNNLADAVNKVEAELGVNPRGLYASTVRERFEQLAFKGQSCRMATAAALAAVTYANGSSGVGATLTANANGVMAAVDGITPVVGDRILVKDQAAALQNGIYVVTSIGAAGAPFVLTRATDADLSAKIADIRVLADGGAVNTDTEWGMVKTAPVLGTDTIPFRRMTPIYGHGNPRNPWDVGADTTQVIATTVPRQNATSITTALTAATHRLVGGIVIPAGRAVTNVNFLYGTAMATITIFWVSIVRLSDRAVLATSANSTSAWAAAPAVKTVALTGAPLTVDYDTPVYVGIAQAATTGGVWYSTPAATAAGLHQRAPVFIGDTTTPTSTPPSNGTTLAALTVPGTANQVPYIWLT